MLNANVRFGQTSRRKESPGKIFAFSKSTRDCVSPLDMNGQWHIISLQKGFQDTDETNTQLIVRNLLSEFGFVTSQPDCEQTRKELCEHFFQIESSW